MMGRQWNLFSPRKVGLGAAGMGKRTLQARIFGAEIRMVKTCQNPGYVWQLGMDHEAKPMINF